MGRIQPVAFATVSQIDFAWFIICLFALHLKPNNTYYIAVDTD